MKRFLFVLTAAMAIEATLTGALALASGPRGGGRSSPAPRQQYSARRAMPRMPRPYPSQRPSRRPQPTTGATVDPGFPKGGNVHDASGNGGAGSGPAIAPSTIFRVPPGGILLGGPGSGATVDPGFPKGGNVHGSCEPHGHGHHHHHHHPEHDRDRGRCDRDGDRAGCSAASPAADSGTPTGDDDDSDGAE